MNDEPLDPRVAELLSALLDGAVTAEERQVAELWLERSEAARAEYRSLHQVKAALGGLGEVEPPFGFYDRMLRQGTPTPVVTSVAGGRRVGRRSLGAAVASVAASAAAFVVVGGAEPDRTVTPSVAAVASGEADGVASLRGAAGGVRVLRQEADGVDWGALPRGERLDRGGHSIWRDLTTEDGQERVVVAGDGVVVVVTGEGVDAEDLIEIGRDVVRSEPAPADGVVDRLRDACEGLVRSLALG